MDISSINAAQIQAEVLNGLNSGLDARPDKSIDILGPMDVHSKPDTMSDFNIQEGLETKVTEVPKTYPMDPTSPLSPGDEILLGMQQSSEDIQGRMNSVNQATQQMYTRSDIPSAAELFQLQILLQSYQFTQELVVRAVSSLNQGIQSLFRNQ